MNLNLPAAQKEDIQASTSPFTIVRVPAKGPRYTAYLFTLETFPIHLGSNDAFNEAIINGHHDAKEKENICLKLSLCAPLAEQY